MSPREAAIKHVLDSVLPWQLFADAKKVLDIGSGAGFPGIPLAFVFPDIRFTLAESIQKKARFLDTAVRALELSNIAVAAERAEELLRVSHFDILTARAVAPLIRAAALIAPALKRGTRALLYKGPDTEAEIAEASAELRRLGLQAQVIHTGSLPDDAGTRTVIEVIARRRSSAH